jgi:hypothetical protein
VHVRERRLPYLGGVLVSSTGISNSNLPPTLKHNHQRTVGRRSCLALRFGEEAVLGNPDQIGVISRRCLIMEI